MSSRHSANKILSVLALAALMLVLPEPAAAQSQRPDLSGIWLLDPERSDDPEELERDAPKDAPRPPSTRGGVVIGGGGRAGIGIGGGFGQPRGFDPQLTRQAIALVREPIERLSITMNGDTIAFATGMDALEAVVADGKRSKRLSAEGLQFEIRASWRGSELRIERKLHNDLKVTQTYALDAASETLTITSQVDGPIPRKIEITRVHRRADPSSS